MIIVAFCSLLPRRFNMATNKRVLELPSDDEGGGKAAGAQEQEQDQNQQLL